MYESGGGLEFAANYRISSVAQSVSKIGDKLFLLLLVSYIIYSED